MRLIRSKLCRKRYKIQTRLKRWFGIGKKEKAHGRNNKESKKR